MRKRIIIPMFLAYVASPIQDDSFLNFNPNIEVCIADKIDEKEFNLPEMNFDYEINEREVHFYNFDPEFVNLEVLILDKPQTADKFLEQAKNRHGDKLEFLTTLGYYDVKSGEPVGRINIDGKIVAKGCYDGGMYLINSSDKLNIDKNIYGIELSKGEWYHGGFGALIINSKFNVEETKKRNLEFLAKKPRTALIIHNDGCSLAFYTGNLSDFAHGLLGLNLGIKDAVTLDSGNSRYFAFRNRGLENEPFTVLKQVNKKRAISSMLCGYLK